MVATIKMTLLFRSKSSRLGLDSAPSPPSPSVSAWEETEDEEDETEEEEDEDFGEQMQKFEPYNPTSISKDEERENDGGGGRGSGQFPILAFFVAALRKSLLVTCSVEREDTSSLDISFPTNVRHVCHVTFDRFNGFLGLPVELQPEVPRKAPSASASVFGVSPQSMQCSIDERGKSVPTILLLMQKHLYQGGGLQAEGIFRINPENSKEEFVRKQLNKGVIPQGMDVHCLAGLIKAWFRELPKGVLDSLTPEQVMHCNSEEECTHLVKQLPPTEAALLDWAINLMADVVHNEHYNKMNARNIAMVFAPNMTQMADPLTALIHAVQVMNLLKTLIMRTLRLRDESNTQFSWTLSPSMGYQDTSNNPQPSISTRDPSFQEKQPHGHKLLRSVTLDRSECSPEKKHRTTQEKYEENDDDDDRKQYATSFSGRSSPVVMSVVSGSGGEVETGILDRLNFRKGVKKLYRHPIFQLSKPSRKTAELGGCK